MNERVIRNLRAAVETMKAACFTAERSIRTGEEREAQAVLHNLAWGFANASNSIECAMNAIEDAHEIAMEDLKVRISAIEADQ